MLDGETVSIYLEDNSSYFSDEHVAQMKNIVSEIDGRIDLDFEFTNDLSASDIDIFLGDRTYQEYLGLATVQEGLDQPRCFRGSQRVNQFKSKYIYP